MTIQLIDALLARRNSLARLLVETVVIDPGILPLLDNVILPGDPGKFLYALRKRQTEFLANDRLESAQIALDVSHVIGLELDYFGWTGKGGLLTIHPGGRV